MKLKLFLVSLISLLLINKQNNACIWLESSEIYRIAMFRAELDYMAGYRPLSYTPELFYSLKPDPDNNDKKLNCAEWQKNIANSIKIEDIYKILYKTEAKKYISWVDKNELTNKIKGNSFINEISKDKNKEWFDYLYFAKQNEYYNEKKLNSWAYYEEESEDESELFYDIMITAEKKLREIKNKELLRRYAFHQTRLFYQTKQYKNCIETYDRYFANKENNNVLKYWALVNKASSLLRIGKVAEANILFAEIFDKCDDKKIRCYQLFSTETPFFNQSLQLARTNKQKADLYTLAAFKYPGRVLNRLKKIQDLDPQSPHLLPLITREINKLEDWIVTTEITSHAPTIYFAADGKTYSNIEFIKKNRNSDNKYLAELAKFIEKASLSRKGEQLNFMKLSLAHLYIMSNQNAKAKKIIKEMKKTSSKSMEIQKTIEEIFLTLSVEKSDIKKEGDYIAQRIMRLEKYAKEDKALSKSIYSLTKKIAQIFEENGEKEYSGLMQLKVLKYKLDYQKFREGWSSDYADYYNTINWFNKNCDEKEMAKLIKLIEKKQKSGLEKYLTDSINVYAYYDLKGTMEFRKNDLENALATFAKIPRNFWKENYSFKKYLNENPFIPKMQGRKRDFTYKFNKYDFVKKMVELKAKAEKDALASLKLANAYYNCSYWGNSWMMHSYFWSYYPDPLYNNDYEKQDLINYYTCKKAEEYYNKALKTAKDDEIKAEALLMLHQCSYNN